MSDCGCGADHLEKGLVHISEEYADHQITVLVGHDNTYRELVLAYCPNQKRLDEALKVIQRLRGVVRLADKLKMYQPVGCSQFRRELNAASRAATAILKETDQPAGKE